MTVLRYRADIDGLRGIAVAAVILYHFKMPGFSGGYVGIDVFFVISGYLITRLLETSAGGYSVRMLGQFYLRRARRILPALFVMLAASTVIATALFLPAHMKNFGRSLALATAFLGNFGAVLDGGYFDPGERFTPLRHLWSIGVEEQFYLFYPLFLGITARYLKGQRSTLIILVALISLILSFWANDHRPNEAYYMLPTRAWELLVGAYVAMNPQLCRGSTRTNLGLATLGVVGLLAVVWYAQVIRFPGISTIGASACTALLIVSNGSSMTLIGRALSWRPVVFTGLISYSLYLWHAPLLAFFGYYNIREPSELERCLILPAVYLVAFFSWAAVEQPFRSQAVARLRLLFVPSAIAVGLALGSVGYWLMKTDGLPKRLESERTTGIAGAPLFPVIDAHCLNLPLDRVSAGELCSFGPQDEHANKVLVWGDSHAYALLPAYQSLANADGIRIYFGELGACWPLLGAEKGLPGEYWRTRCEKFNRAMIEAVRRLNPRRVILNAYWRDPAGSAESEFFRRGRESKLAVVDGIERTLSEIRSPDRSVCAVLTVPGYSYPIPYALAIAQRRHIDPATLSMTHSEALSEYQAVEGELRLLASQNQLQVVDPKDALCAGAQCLMRAGDGTPLYLDGNHLSSPGAHLVLGVLEQCVSDLHTAMGAAQVAPTPGPAPDLTPTKSALSLH
ncbi:MAG TPA: acyltransferase family protein [Steroidobacteraceae bacterium]|jgi:peptidoglycan/LPS O-acetylase OafA/YrhL|nr:acyltransferase family protein [Steroidobacteraceae bacterium]